MTTSSDEAMRRIDALLSHVWMVRAFLKHSEEAEDDTELQDIHRALYDFMLALGAPWKEQNSAAYLKQAQKKFGKLNEATAHFFKIQPDVSLHTNFQMAVQSLQVAVEEIGQILTASTQ